MGYLVLEGGSEFTGRMSDVDLRALELAGGLESAVNIIPAAAAPDSNHIRAGQNGVGWFTSLGASRVASLPLIDRQSAGRPDICAALESSRLIFLLGGFPGYLLETLVGTPAWQAVSRAWSAGGLLAGSSAGAMMLCEKMFDPYRQRLADGLGVMPGSCFIPHHNTFGKTWAGQLRNLLPEAILIGVDEQTGLVYEGRQAGWQVLGGGAVTIYEQGRVGIYHSTDRPNLPVPAWDQE